MIRNAKRRAALIAVAGTAILGIGLSGCAGGGGDDSGESEGRTLRVWAGSQTPIEANFNPFSPSVLHAALGPIYEPLFFYNKTADDAPAPMLGESFEYNEDGTVITVKLKEGVKWNDGEDFTADDAAFTFNYEPNHRDGLISAEATDDTTVVLTYETPQFTNEFQILGTTWMLPEHIWSEVDDYTTFTDEEPVGTGPYVVDNVTDASYTVVANDEFRDEGVPGDQEAAVHRHRRQPVRPGPADRRRARLDRHVRAEPGLGHVQRRDQHAQHAAGPDGALHLLERRPRLHRPADRRRRPPGAQRRDRPRHHQGEGLRRPDRRHLADLRAAAARPEVGRRPAPTRSARSRPTPRRPVQILEAAGYTKGGDGFYGKDGAPLELSLISVDGWTDYNDAAKLISEQAAEAGIKVNASTVQWQEFSDARQTGQYQLIMGGVIGTSVADPFQIYKDWFAGESTSQVGEEVPSGRWNFSRYDNPVVERGRRRGGRHERRGRRSRRRTPHSRPRSSRDLPVHPAGHQRHPDVLQHEGLHGLADRGRPVRVPARVGLGRGRLRPPAPGAGGVMQDRAEAEARRSRPQ